VSLVLLVVAVAVLGDVRVNSGSDAGGKTATVANIVENGHGGVDLEYWAEDVDPDGLHHPFLWTTYREDRGWIQITGSAMPLASSAGQRVAGGLGALSPLTFMGRINGSTLLLSLPRYGRSRCWRKELSLRQFLALGLTAGVAVVLRQETALVLGVMAMVELLDKDRRRWWLSHISPAT